MGNHVKGLKSIKMHSSTLFGCVESIVVIKCQKALHSIDTHFGISLLFPQIYQPGPNNVSGDSFIEEQEYILMLKTSKAAKKSSI
jgi:hypothetical protein